MQVEHEFETTMGDELSHEDLDGASYKVTETYVSTCEGMVVFTHRIEMYMTDDQLIALIENPMPRDDDDPDPF